MMQAGKVSDVHGQASGKGGARQKASIGWKGSSHAPRQFGFCRSRREERRHHVDGRGRDKRRPG
jgi:hypothetical protein